MELEKPLHVQVAEALGWTQCDPELESERWEFSDEIATIIGLGIPPGGERRQPLPHYDTDWSATGPLIEKYRLCINPEDLDWDDRWEAIMGPYDSPSAGTKENPAMPGATPLIAVCNLILLLAEAGKLKAA